MADARAGGGSGTTLPDSEWIGPGGIRWGDLGLFLFGGIVRVVVGSFTELIARFVDGVVLVIGFGGASLRAVITTALGSAAGVLESAGVAAGPTVRSFGPFAIVVGIAVMLASAFVAVRVFNGVVSRG